ncbi:TolC family protein [bacterium]|nr:TolC family protein [bacterium]
MNILKRLALGSGHTAGRPAWSLFTILLVLMSQTFGASAQENSATSSETIHELTLEQCLIQALEANFEVVLARIDYQSQLENVKREKASFDPRSTFNSGYRSSETKLSSVDSYLYGGIDAYESDVFSFDTTLSQQLYTGGNYSFNFGTDRTTGTFITEAGPDYDGDGTPDDLDGDGIPDSKESQEYNTSFSLSLAHPLLRNFGIVVNKGSLLMAENNNIVSLANLQQTIIATVSEVQGRYWDLVLAMKNVEVIQKSLLLARDFLDLTNARVNLGTLPPIEIVIAEAEVANREESIINAINTVKNCEDNLRHIMNVPPDHTLWESQIIPVTKPDFDQVEVDYDHAITTAFENRLDYQQAQLNLQNQEIALKMARNAALPGLDFNASVAMSDVDNDLDESISGTFSGDSVTLYGGLSLEIPWWNQAARASKIQAEYALQRAQIGLKKFEEQLRLEVRYALRDIETSLKQIKAARKSLELSQKKLEAEQKKYEIGISTSFNVIEYQKDLAQAESNETIAIVAYTKSVVNLYQTLGLTLDKNFITVDETGQSSRLVTE